VLMSDVAGRLQIMERTTLANNSTRYTMRASQAGRYRLEFSRQLPTGYEKKEVELVIEPYRVQSPATASVVNSEDSLRAMSAEERLKRAKSEQDVAPLVVWLQQAKQQLPVSELKQVFDLLWQERVYAKLALELGDAFVVRFKNDPMSAQVLYRMAQLYEGQGQERDLRRAYNYYRRVFEEYPITPYSRLSKERMDYLDRFFFQIQ
jgi:TPR repeat protein